jgi:ABC-type amino acid transport substrate-binding protein
MKKHFDFGTAFLVAFVAAATCAPTSACAQSTIDKIRQTNIINIGYRESSIPFAYLDDAKKPIGYSLDICAQLVEGIKRELKLPKLATKFVPVQAAERIPFVVDGKVDLECGNTTATAERKTKAAFTMPIFIAGAATLARADPPKTSLRDFRGKQIIIAAGTTGEKVLAEANKSSYDIKPFIAKNNTEAFAALKDAKADGWITDDVLLAGFRANADKPSDYVLLEKRHTIEPLAIMMRLNDPAFESLVDREMTRLVNEEKLQALYQKWFTSPIPPKGINLGLPPGRLLREYFRFPTKSVSNVDIILL